MNCSYIQEVIPIRMKELGHGDNYTTEMRTINLPPTAKISISAYNTLIFFPMDFMGATFPVTVESDFGFLSFIGIKHNEQSFEHTGQIILTNTGTSAFMLTMIRAIPEWEPKPATNSQLQIAK